MNFRMKILAVPDTVAEVVYGLLKYVKKWGA